MPMHGAMLGARVAGTQQRARQPPVRWNAVQRCRRSRADRGRSGREADQAIHALAGVEYSRQHDRTARTSASHCGRPNPKASCKARTTAVRRVISGRDRRKAIRRITVASRYSSWINRTPCRPAPTATLPSAMLRACARQRGVGRRLPAACRREAGAERVPHGGFLRTVMPPGSTWMKETRDPYRPVSNCRIGGHP